MIRVRRSSDAVHVDHFPNQEASADWGVRFARESHMRLFSERHQITARWRYLAGHRIAIRTRTGRLSDARKEQQ